MTKSKNLNLYIFLLSLIVIFISGCVYLTHLEETLFLKSMAANQKDMQAQLNKEERLFNKLKNDMDKGRLHKQMPKRSIFYVYGESTLCKQAQAQTGINETCIYRLPGGLSTELILLNFDSQGKLFSWEIQKPEK